MRASIQHDHLQDGGQLVPHDNRVSGFASEIGTVVAQSDFQARCRDRGCVVDPVADHHKPMPV